MRPLQTQGLVVGCHWQLSSATLTVRDREKGRVSNLTCIWPALSSQPPKCTAIGRWQRCVTAVMSCLPPARHKILFSSPCRTPLVSGRNSAKDHGLVHWTPSRCLRA
ncbi:hypothetical protein BDP55DRAFT_662434 [Colletotrichum godetiae]|uniref:Uncharacterized protein n=1 Tax=Colletotrichum godetiae TaxID=1209918 RepID=A0AAJ0AN94_9PEZI|nr:uncharacterized protein BDP55DRAFT_662434 [Colletotrichum godetiae]KAK1676379.1 hypothetical protein BDP55DRAFT_662434 [Colletotrichum godetiae]